MKIILLILILLSSNIVSASLIGKAWEDGTVGNENLTYDSQSGLEWLNVSLNVGVSADSMLLQLNSPGIYSDFRYASQADVQGVLLSAGLNEHGVCYFCSDTADVLDLFGHFGITYDWTNVSLSKGIHAFVAETAAWGGRYWSAIEYDPGAVGDPWTAVVSHASAASTDVSIDNGGHFLVRDAIVPIPASIWLFLSGVVVFARCSRIKA